jgi:hypothetical protein
MAVADRLELPRAHGNMMGPERNVGSPNSRSAAARSDARLTRVGTDIAEGRVFDLRPEHQSATSRSLSSISAVESSRI